MRTTLISTLVAAIIAVCAVGYFMAMLELFGFDVKPLFSAEAESIYENVEVERIVYVNFDDDGGRYLVATDRGTFTLPRATLFAGGRKRIEDALTILKEGRRYTILAKGGWSEGYLGRTYPVIIEARPTPKRITDAKIEL